MKKRKDNINIDHLNRCRKSKWQNSTSIPDKSYHLNWGFPDGSVGKKICLPCRRLQFDSWVGKIHWKRDRLPTPVFLGFPCGSVGKESACNAGDLASIPGLGRSPGKGKGYPLQYSGLKNFMDCIVHGVTKSWTRLSDFHFSLQSWYRGNISQHNKGYVWQTHS